MKLFSTVFFAAFSNLISGFDSDYWRVDWLTVSNYVFSNTLWLIRPPNLRLWWAKDPAAVVVCGSIWDGASDLAYDNSMSAMRLYFPPMLPRCLGKLFFLLVRAVDASTSGLKKRLPLLFKSSTASFMFLRFSCTKLYDSSHFDSIRSTLNLVSFGSLSLA